MVASLAAVLAAPVAQAQPAANSCNIDVAPQRLPRMVLDIAVTCAVNSELTLRAGTGRMADFVSEMRDAGGRRVEAAGREWSAPAHGRVATLAYRFDLDSYLEEANRVTSGLRRGDTRLALLDAWLLQPLSSGLGLPLALRVRQTPETRFATGLRHRDGAWHLAELPVRFAGYTVFGGFKIESVPVPAPGSLAVPRAAGSAASAPAYIDVVTVDGALEMPLPHLVDWVRQSAAAVGNYFDGYSDQRSLVVLLPTQGSGVPFGRVVPGGGISMVVLVGQSASARNLYNEWVLVHEMIHTAMPFIYGGTWLMEGSATYLEPVIRHRAGWKSEADVWREWIENMERGLPALTEIGLRNGGSPYWGGALFLLLADIEIRRATDLRLGIEDCFRSVLQGGANAVERWSVEEMFAACDQLTGKPVMAGLARRHVEGVTPLSLPSLWRELGVELRDGIVLYDDRAPLAAIRDLIVKGPQARRGRPVPMGRT